MKDRRTAIVIIFVSAIAMTLALTVTIANPSQDLTFAFGEPNEFQRKLDSCLKKADNVVNCLPSTISPSSSEPESTTQAPLTPVSGPPSSEAQDTTQAPVTPVIAREIN